MTFSLILAYIITTAIPPLVPGPATLNIFTDGIFGGRKKALFSAFGVWIGDGGLIVLSFLFFYFLKQSPDIFMLILGILGALYLGYSGYKILRNPNKNLEKNIFNQESQKYSTNLKYFWNALFISFLNPKALISIISVYTSFSLINNSVFALSLLTIIYLTNTFLIYMGIAIGASHKKIQNFFLKNTSLLHWMMGGIFLFFAFILLIFSGEKIYSLL